MMMTTKGILISEKDCQPQRKEKRAKKKIMKTKRMRWWNITLDDLTKLSLDSESEAAKKFGCGTTRFKTMCVWCDALIHFFCLLISLHESISVFDHDLLFISLSLSSWNKNRCRKFGIIRWPHRKLHSLLEMYKSLAGYYQVKIDFDFSFYY